MSPYRLCRCTMLMRLVAQVVDASTFQRLSHITLRPGQCIPIQNIEPIGLLYECLSPACGRREVVG